jgi:hypothetical protein
MEGRVITVNVEENEQSNPPWQEARLIVPAAHLVIFYIEKSWLSHVFKPGSLSRHLAVASRLSEIRSAHCGAPWLD